MVVRMCASCHKTCRDTGGHLNICLLVVILTVMFKINIILEKPFTESSFGCVCGSKHHHMWFEDFQLPQFTSSKIQTSLYAVLGIWWFLSICIKLDSLVRLDQKMTKWTTYIGYLPCAKLYNHLPLCYLNKWFSAWDRSPPGASWWLKMI